MKFDEAERLLASAVAEAKRGPGASVRESDRRLVRASMAEHCFFCGHPVPRDVCRATDRTIDGELRCGCTRTPDTDR
jgi:hypothetical protein